MNAFRKPSRMTEVYCILCSALGGDLDDLMGIELAKVCCER